MRGWTGATTEERAAAQQLLAAVLKAAYGDLNPGLAELGRRYAHDGEQGLFSALYGITKPAMDILNADTPGSFMVGANEGSIDDAPPGLRAAARFVAAVGNDDGATALALMRALPDDESGVMFLQTVLTTAGTLWKHVAETRIAARGDQ